MNKLNNPESGVTDIVKSEIPIKIPAPAAGGSRKYTPRRTQRLRRSTRRKHTRHRRNKK
jgi:hypothetical protein